MEYTVEAARVTATENGEEFGEMTFVDSGAFYIIDHTGVYDNARGKGVGKGLVSTFVEHARTEGKQVLPLCPFAKAEFDKNPDYHDVLKHKNHSFFKTLSDDSRWTTTRKVVFRCV